MSSPRLGKQAKIKASCWAKKAHPTPVQVSPGIFHPTSLIISWKEKEDNSVQDILQLLEAVSSEFPITKDSAFLALFLLT